MEMTMVNSGLKGLIRWLAHVKQESTALYVEKNITVSFIEQKITVLLI